jgi:dTMP kinase
VGFSIRNRRGFSIQNPKSKIQNTKGTFITFEGIDKCGKTTQARRLVENLTHAGHKVVFTREPGGTAISEQIRDIVLHWKAEGMTRWTELFLMIASRAQHTEKVILPALDEGKVVICDRYSDSTVAYQGYGRGLALDTIADLNRIATLGLTPDLTILIDISVKEAVRRHGRPSLFDEPIERQEIVFYEHLREGFLSLLQLDPDRFLVIDGTQRIDRIEAEIEQIVVEKLKVRDARNRNRAP